MAIKDIERKFIKEQYFESKSIKKTRESFLEKYGYSPSKETVHKIWESAGFRLCSYGGYRYGVPKEEFYSIYEKNKGDFLRIKKHLGLTDKQLSRLSIKYKKRLLNKPVKSIGEPGRFKIGNGKIKTKGKLV